MAPRDRAVENSCVFSARLKVLSDRSGDRSSGGRRFHVAGPLTAKLRCLVAVRARGTRVPVAAMQMLTTWDSSEYAEVTEIGRSNTMNRLPDHQGRLEDYSLTNRIFKNWGDVFTSAHSRHHTSSHVLHIVVSCSLLCYIIIMCCHCNVVSCYLTSCITFVPAIVPLSCPRIGREIH